MAQFLIYSCLKALCRNYHMDEDKTERKLSARKIDFFLA